MLNTLADVAAIVAPWATLCAGVVIACALADIVERECKRRRTVRGRMNRTFHIYDGED